MSDFDPDKIRARLCSKCAVVRPVAEFRRHRTYCKPCERSGCRAWGDANKEYKKQYGRSYFSVHGKRINAERSEIKKAWAEKNKDRIAEIKARYRKENKEQVYASNAARRAMKRGAVGRYTKAEVTALYEAQNGCCVYCRSKLGTVFHRDHIIPLVAGGRNDIGNIQLLCPTCNLRKNKKLPDEFARSMSHGS